MDFKNYFLQCIEFGDVQELSLAYAFLGRRTCTKDTAAYIQGTAYQILEEGSPFNHRLVYCDENYFGKIDWSKITTLDEAQQTTIRSGLTCTCFTFLDAKIDDLSVDTFLSSVEESYKPFSKYSAVPDLNNILIDDDQYYQIMQVIGQPYIKDRELEYNRQAILKLAVEPALREYYTYFPLIQEETIPHKMGDFMIQYPTEPYPAYKAIAWVTTAGTSGRSLNGISPLAALGTDVSLYTRTAQGSHFGGLQYNKPVPGYNGRESATAGQSAYTEMAQQWPIANTMKNIMKREKLSKIHVPGKGLFAKGYSTMSGYLNIKWLCWSRDFNDVEFEDWFKVIQLCQAHVKFSMGGIRDLLRQDSNIPFREGIQKEGKEEIDAIIKEWSESPSRLTNVSSRGGLVG